MSDYYKSSKTRNAKEEDRFLQKNYGYSLWHFSLSLAKNYHLFPRKDYREEAGFIGVLKKEKRNREKDLDRYWKMPLIRNYHHFLIKNKEEEIKEIDGMLNSQKITGIRAKRINILALVWSYFIDRPVEIIELLAWFKKRLENIAIYKPFCDGVDKISKESLRKLLYRHKTDGIHKVWVEEYRNLFISAFPAGLAISFKYKDKGSDGNDTPVEPKGLESARKGTLFRIERLEKSDWHKDTPLLTFPKDKDKGNDEILTVGDFEENNRILKVEDKNRAHAG